MHAIIAIHVLAATLSSQSITGASWFLPWIIGIFCGLFIGKKWL